jgi:ribonucleotide monophosphatase NagD (HAD superfamily)
MRSFGVPDDAYDATVTSGDVTRELLMRWQGGNVFLIGPERTIRWSPGCRSTLPA